MKFQDDNMNAKDAYCYQVVGVSRLVSSIATLQAIPKYNGLKQQ